MMLTLAVGLAACRGPDPEQARHDLESMKAAVNAELRDMADTLTASGITVERANGGVESGGMGGYASEDYSVSALLVADGEEGDQIEKATAALEQSGWSRTAGDLEAPEPWVQLQREDFRTTISWTKFGPRELWFSLDQDGEVEVPEDTPIVDRNNSEDIPLD